MAMTGEHALDVLSRLRDWQAAGRPIALIIVTQTEGGAVRAPGALLAVSDTDHIGYISGGCIDADVVLQARQAIEVGAQRSLRYGAGSPFVDLPLPCGGAICVSIFPQPSADMIETAAARLEARESLFLHISEDEELFAAADRLPAATTAKTFRYDPKLRIRIAGRGADALALAKMSDAAGFETQLQLIDDLDLASARGAGLQTINKLTTVAALADAEDDAWTAFVLLFHDQDWEIPLLKQALNGPAFYIGAVGSARTHAKRIAALLDAGVPQDSADRVNGPIGLVPSLRDASLLAVSALAEIIEAYTARVRTPAPKTALVLLAAGASERYEHGDKLMADLDGAPLLEKAAALRAQFPSKQAIAVIPRGAHARRDVVAAHDWTILENPNAHLGQSTSLKTALNHLSSEDIDQIIVLLGDMPNLSRDQIEALLLRAEADDVDAIMCESAGVLSPPALFKRTLFDALSAVTGDRGAKSVFLSLTAGAETISVSPGQIMDVDRVADLERAKELSHA